MTSNSKMDSPIMNKYRLRDNIIWYCSVLISISIMFLLVYKQAMYPNIYNSDIDAYMESIRNLDSNHVFSYPVMFYLAIGINYLIDNIPISMAITVTIFNLLAYVISGKVIQKQTGSILLSVVGTIFLFFSSMIFNHRLIQFGIPHYCIGVGTPNPWHNATYVAARPFVILCFVLGAYTLCHYEEDFQKKTKYRWETHKYYVFFTIAMLVCTLTKPAYNLPHMAVVFIVAVYRCLKNRFKTIVQSLMLATTYLPTIGILIWQYFNEFTGTYNGDEQGMTFSFGGTWKMYSDNIPLAILLAALFPFIVLIIHRKKLLESEQFRFSWQIYLAGVLIYLCLIEKGYRAKDGNFGWGYLHGLFLIYFTSIEEWILDIKLMREGNLTSKLVLIVIVETVAILLHFIFGVHYLQLLFMGFDYKLPWY